MPFLLAHKNKGGAIPPAFICGNAWTLPDDLEKAFKLYKDPFIIAVNGAAKEIKANVLFSQHPEYFIEKGWIRKQQRFWDGFEVHSIHEYPYVDKCWDIEKGGGSAWLARKAASLMGFNNVVLCGCPMEVGPYVGNHNLGGLMYREDIVDELFTQIKNDVEWHKGVISMSGRTRDLLC